METGGQRNEAAARQRRPRRHVAVEAVVGGLLGIRDEIISLVAEHPGGRRCLFRRRIGKLQVGLVLCAHGKSEVDRPNSLGFVALDEIPGMSGHFRCRWRRIMNMKQPFLSI